MNADEALKSLMDGNKRYLAGKSTYGWNKKTTDKDKREQLANTQNPIAIIVGCSDSRVPPEIIFDQRLGDLFVIRVAGNVVDGVVLGSIEFAEINLSPLPLLFVLGHNRCNAVTAAVNVAPSERCAKDQIANILHRIDPAVEEARKLNGPELVDDAITANIKNIVEQLKNSKPHLKEAVENNSLKIVGGRYDLDTGKITMVA